MNGFWKQENRFNLIAFISGFFWLLIGSMFFIIPLYVIGPKVAGVPFQEFLTNEKYILEHSYIPGCLGHLFGITIFVILYKKTIVDDAIKFKNSWWKALIIITLGFGLLYLSNYLMTLIYDALGYGDQTSQNQQSIIDALTGKTKTFVIIYTVILAPLFEEIIFRKLFYNTLKQNTRLPIWAIVLIISIVFAGIHVIGDIDSLVFFPQYFVLALVITISYAISKENLLVSTSLHFLNNLVSVLEIL